MMFMDTLAETSAGCTQCGKGELHAKRISTALWEEERLVVVEGILAMVCSGCGERFFDDETAVRLDLLRGAGFPAAKACGELRVPVFTLDCDAEGTA